MELLDLGIDKNGVHSRTLTRMESEFIGVLIEHQGRDNKISANALAYCLECALTNIDLPVPEEREKRGRDAYKHSPQAHEQQKREVRHLHNHLLFMHDHLPILSKAGIGGGYWLAETDDEAEAFYETFRGRAMTGLKKASRGRASLMADAMTQLAFEWEEEQKNQQTGLIRPRVGMPAPLQVVDSMLEELSRNPEQFADGLRKIGQKYNSVLLDKSQVAAMQAKVTELQDVLTGLTG